MREALAKWISDADAIRQFEHFEIPQQLLDLAYVRNRSDDYYISLVGELFDRLRDGFTDPKNWARLGNAIAQFAQLDAENLIRSGGISHSEAYLYASAAYYFGGFPPSAYLTLSRKDFKFPNEVWAACYDLLARPAELKSETVQYVLAALREGRPEEIVKVMRRVKVAENEALQNGPQEWIPLRLLDAVLDRFNRTNLRAVLPEGQSAFWDQFIASMLGRRPASWDFFPSQIQAIQNGLLTKSDSCSLQMPTGAGKTTLMETLLYWQLKRNSKEVAILLVPYRSLASELRNSLVHRLNALGISARAAYGGTIPSAEEINNLDQLQAVVSTPETLSGLLAANPNFLGRVSLVICDEGHLLDGDGRGIVLELLLARMKVREGGQPRFVFISAIVPNIEEINSWLAGNIYPGFVVRSDYRPALAEFALLNSDDRGVQTLVNLIMHPHEPDATRFSIAGFLSHDDFRYHNARTGRQNTYPFTSVKTQALASARKSLKMGAVAVFTANKRGDQGAIGLAEGLLAQLQHPLNLPLPSDFMSVEFVRPAIEYLNAEYGSGWIGTMCLSAGVVLHHGDIPQETREVLEYLLRNELVKFAICTSTLAEGVNLPIRTLVLYSVQRRNASGPPENMLGRDIKNLVGRAGRPGSATKGLVICANPEQWVLVKPVAQQAAGEPVYGALSELISRLKGHLAAHRVLMTNDWLERSASLDSLVDGIDSVLMDLITEEIGLEQLREVASNLAKETFAAKRMDKPSRAILEGVFKLRAEKLIDVRDTGRLGWIRETGAKLRLVDTVESELLPSLNNWDAIQRPLDEALVQAILNWSWKRPTLQRRVRRACRLPEDVETETVRETIFEIVRMWIRGASFAQMCAALQIAVDDALAIYSQVVSFELQTIVEQGISILQKLLESQNKAVSSAVMEFPELLRFGVPSLPSLVLAQRIRHRRAAVQLGGHHIFDQHQTVDPQQVFAVAHEILRKEQSTYLSVLGKLIYDYTVRELTVANRRRNQRD